MNLDIEEVRRETALNNGKEKASIKIFQQRGTSTKVLGDLVLRNCQASRPASEHIKLSSNWEGHYQVSEIVGRGAYRLVDAEGKKLLNTWNAQHLVKYYQ